MRLLEEDEIYLTKKGYRWEVLSDMATNPPGGLLVIHDFPIDGTVYDQEKCDLMIRIPPGYNMAQLDMFYVDPPVRLRSGAYPRNAGVFETYGNRAWQRFSRHLPPHQPWRAGVDTIQAILPFAVRELSKGQV